MGRDDWMYDEEAFEGEEEDVPPPPEKQCPNCLHWVLREAPYCAWCGKPFEEPR